MDLGPILRLQNPWLEGRRAPLPPRYVPRRAEDLLVRWKDPARALVLTGPRQSGKSTLLMRWVQQALDSGRLQPHEVLYCSADHVGLRDELELPERVLRLARAMAGGLPKLLIIDEVQRLSEPGLLVKQLVDLRTGMQIAVSGSASLRIRSHAREHLTGRQMEVLLQPLDLGEVVGARPQLAPLAGATGDELARRWPMVGGALQEAFEELAVWGGYPAVVTATTEPARRSILTELYDTYLRRDVVDFLRVASPAAFNRMVGLLAEQVGGLVVRAELARSAGLSAPTVESYLSALEDTHVVTVVRPFHTNPRTEIVKAPKAYFVDTGLRNASLGRLGALSGRADRGGLVENAVVSECLKRLPPHVTVHFWRSKAQAEVDVVLRAGSRLVAIEVKAGVLTQPRVSRGFRSFVERYQPVATYVLNSHGLVRSETGPTLLPHAAFLLELPQIVERLTG